MMGKIARVNVSFYVYETESLAKNISIVKRIIGLEALLNSDIRIEILEGAYGNKVLFLEIFVKNAQDVKKTIKTLATKLSNEEKETLFKEFDVRFDPNKKVFHIRFDKSAGYKEKRLRLSYSSYSIKLALKLTSFTPKTDFRELLCQSGLLKEN